MAAYSGRSLSHGLSRTEKSIAATGCAHLPWTGGRVTGQGGSPRLTAETDRHSFVTANAGALGVLRAELPQTVGWVEFRPEGRASPHTLAYRIVNRARPTSPAV
jgi:hypothetical protein